MPLPSIAQDIPLEQAGTLAGPTPPAAAPLSLLDQIKLGWKQDAAQPDWGFNSVNWRESAISEVADALRKKGVEPIVHPSDGGDVERKFPFQRGEQPGGPEDRAYRALFAQVAKIRQTDPTFLKDYEPVLDKASFDQLLASRRRATLQDVAERAPDGLGAGGFAGSIGHRAIDPINYLPVGGEGAAGLSFGQRILVNGLRWGAFNTGITAIEEPLVREQARQLGIERNAQDFVTDLTGAAVSGFALGGLHEGIRLTPSAIREGSFAAAPRRYEADKFGRALNEAVAGADMPAASPFHSFDARVARAFAKAVPQEERTPDEKAAVSAIERDAEVKATSPFVPSPAGDDVHTQSLDAGMRALSGEAGAARPSVKPIAREAVAEPQDVAGTRMPARELVKAKIHSVEGDGPNKLGGHALGPYQFEPRTWVSLFKRRYPGDQRSFDQIAALRSDPHLNDVMMNDLLAENAAALRHAGFEENAGNLYLAHVLGHDRAVTVLRADPNARLADLLPHDYFAKNPFKPTDSAASLVHWAYGKMGEKGLPEHIAAVPDAAAGGEAIAAAETPDTAQTTGRFDVEALYGDVGMADRPVLRPELFASPEEHAAAQLRFERDRDASEGFAPVMSRAEAFSPSEHFDAVRAYARQRGTVTPEAIGEALGLSPEEVKRVVGAMQATDPNSPYVLSRGRQPKMDKFGNVTREGTEPGRIVRRPPKPGTAGGPETMLEYLTRTGGGLKDEGGDLASMGADAFHKAKPFRKKLIDNEGGQTLDDAFQRAIEAGYFPEHMAEADTYADLPDIKDFHAAIDEELRGHPRYSVNEAVDAAEAARRARYAEEPTPEPEPQVPDREALLERVGHNYEPIVDAARRQGVTVTDDMMIHASDLIDAGEHADVALENAIVAQTYRDLEEIGYGFDHAGQRFADDTGLAEPRGGDGVDPADEFGGGRPQSDEEATAGGGAQLAQSAHDPATAEFSDPVGTAAEGQADSLVHDLQMAVAKPSATGTKTPGVFFHGSKNPNLTSILPGREVGADSKLGRTNNAIYFTPDEKLAWGYSRGGRVYRVELITENPKIVPVHDIVSIRDADLAKLRSEGYDSLISDNGHEYVVFDQHQIKYLEEGMGAPTYRLEENGHESDLASILAEIEDAQKATTEMRNCLKPKGGEE